jgi:6-phosphogluconolactonase
MQRRSFLAFSATAASAVNAATANSRIYIGTYTRDQSEGIYTATFDAFTGRIGQPALAAKAKNASFVIAGKGQSANRLFAVMEHGDLVSATGKKTGSVASFDRASDGSLTLVNQVSTEGASPCHLDMDRAGKRLVVANYSGGNVSSFLVGADGQISAAKGMKQHAGKGPHQRQEGPHAHSANIAPDGKTFLACDLGLDQVRLYTLSSSGELADREPAKIDLAPGAGPRHLALHPKQPVLYVTNELDSTVTMFRYAKGWRNFTNEKSVSTLPSSSRDKNTTAEIAVHPNGKFVYVSNRGHDSLAVFDSALNLIGHVSTMGKNPRSFVVDRKGRWLLAANQNGNNVVAYEIDGSSGMPKPTGQQISVAWPVCVMLV